MPDQGPTNVGSISAKIGATITELQAKVGEAKTLLKDLTGEDTKVKVGADVAEAISKLDAVQAKLGEVETQNDVLRRSLEKTNDTNQRSGGYWKTIALAVGALIPLMAPLAGYAAGVAGALGVMGVSGVLAVLGVKAAMEQGTSVGSAYAAGLQVLKGDLNELSGTSAVSMLQSYYAAIGQINAAMPSLNTETGLFAKQLGAAGNFLLGALLTGLRVAQPLLLTAGVYIQQVAAGLLSWTKNGGLQSFVQYAIGQLPKVAQALGQLADLALRFVQATSPIGTVVLDALSGVVSALNALPLPVLTAMVAAGGSFFLAYKAWAALSPILDAVSASLASVGVAEDLALGPIGLVVAAVTALGAAVGVTAVAMQQGTLAQEDYTAAVQQDNGVVGDNVKAQAAKNLQTQVGIDTEKALGISTKELTDATLGSTAAHAKLEDALKKAQDEFYKTAKAGETNTKAAQDQQVAYAKLQAAQQALASSDTEKQAIQKAIKAYNDLQNAIGGTTISTREQLQAEMDNANQYGLSLTAYEKAKAAQQQQAQQTRDTAAAMVQENDAAGLLRNALDILNGKTLNVAEAQTGLAAANNSITDSFKQNGQAIDGNSKAAVANQQAIQQAIQQAQQYAEAIGTQTGSTVQATQALSDSKQALEDNLRKYGDLTPAVQAYIDKIFKIPTTVNTVVSLDTAVAETKVDQLAKDIVNLTSIYQSVTARMPDSIAVTKAYATGGTISGYATGGTIPGLAGGGPSGTVFGPGSSTSDSILTRLSVGEEVTKASSANYPGVRPLLKAINYDPPGVMNALAAPRGGYTYAPHLHVDGAGWSVDQLFAEFDRRQLAKQNARVA